MAARPGAAPLYATAGDGKDQGEGGVYVEEWEAVAELSCRINVRMQLN